MTCFVSDRVLRTVRATRSVPFYFSSHVCRKRWLKGLANDKSCWEASRKRQRYLLNGFARHAEFRLRNSFFFFVIHALSFLASAGASRLVFTPMLISSFLSQLSKERRKVISAKQRNWPYRQTSTLNEEQVHTRGSLRIFF